jgi:hypothetical protein
MGHSLVSVCGPKRLLFFLSTLVALLAALSGLLALLPRRWFLTLLLLSTLRVIALLLLRLFQFLFFLPVHWLFLRASRCNDNATLHDEVPAVVPACVAHEPRVRHTSGRLFPTGQHSRSRVPVSASDPWVPPLRSRRLEARFAAAPVPKLAYWLSAVDNSAMMPRQSNRPGTSCRQLHLSKE